jgi:hypothetical protein
MVSATYTRVGKFTKGTLFHHKIVKDNDDLNDITGEELLGKKQTMETFSIAQGCWVVWWKPIRVLSH